MSSLWWWPFLLGAIGVSIIELVRHLNERRGRLTIPSHPTAVPTLWERVRYWSWCIAFFVVLLPAEWIAAGLLDTQKREQSWAAALLFTAGWWLLLGLVPAAVSAIRGRAQFDAFKATVEYHLRSSFKSLVRVWMLGIGIMVLFALQGMIN